MCSQVFTQVPASWSGRSRAATAACCVAAAFFSPAATADEYCVSCTAPAAVYRCVIEGTSEKLGTDPREQLTCIKQLAEAGGHESCSVARSAPYPCPGLVRLVAKPQGELAPPAEAVAEPNQPPPEAGETVEPKHAPPRTVEELAKDTVKSSQQGLQKAGEAVTGSAKSAGEQIGKAGSAVGEGIGKAGSSVGSAAKKTWDCLVSLFKNC